MTDHQDDDAVLVALKAVHAAGGHPLSREEVVQFVSKSPTLLGPLRPEEEPRRGPKTTRTIYDDALDRRKNLYRLLVKQPKRNRDEADVGFDRDAIAQVASYLEQLRQPKRVTVGNVLIHWNDVHKGVSCPSRATLCRRIAELRKTGGIKA